MDIARIRQLAQQNEENVISLRRQIHRNPELADREFKTSALVRAELDRLGIEYITYPDMTAVVGIVRGAKDGPTVGLRADMDALPLDERTGLPFASETPGVMHACGHDSHTAMLLGAGYVLQQMRDSFCGNVKLFFQPAEEGNGGSMRMIEAGCMENPHVSEVYGTHIGGKDLGTLGTKPGPTHAFSDEITIVIHGKKSHGAWPVGGVDAVLVASQVVVATHTLPSRRVSATDSICITVGAIHGGKVSNIVCDRVELEVMFRTLDTETRERVVKEFEDLVHGICAANGATAEFIRSKGYDGQVNEEYLVRRLECIATEILGPGSFIETKTPGLGTEDFCYFGQAAPSVFYHLGSGSAPGHEPAPGHSSEYTINEAAFINGVMINCALALDGLERLNANQ